MVNPTLTMAIRRRPYRSHRFDQKQMMKGLRAIFIGQSSPASRRREKVTLKTSALDAEGRCWPILSAPPANRVSELESTVAELRTELSLRCTQVADLYNKQQGQESDVLDACDEINRLVECIDTLQGTIIRREAEAATADKRIITLENENVGLRVKLESTQRESVELLNRLLSVETAFNDREIAIISTQEKNLQLKEELIATRHDADKLMAATETGNEQCCNEINQRHAQLARQIQKIEAACAEQRKQAKNLAVARAMLLDCCDQLAEAVSGFETVKRCAGQESMPQTENGDSVVGGERTVLQFPRGVSLRTRAW
jgi:chromosome segregation ATPase